MSHSAESKLSLDLEDDLTFVINPDDSSAKVSAPSPPVRGCGLDLSRAAAFKGHPSEFAAEEQIQEQTVTVIFDLPDGSQGESEFKLGHTVELLKSFVENEYGIPMPQQTMYIEDTMLIDPLSLLDYPDAKLSDEIFIRVDGPLPSESKK